MRRWGSKDSPVCAGVHGFPRCRHFGISGGSRQTLHRMLERHRDTTVDPVLHCSVSGLADMPGSAELNCHVILPSGSPLEELRLSCRDSVTCVASPSHRGLPTETAFGQARSGPDRNSVPRVRRLSRQMPPTEQTKGSLSERRGPAPIALAWRTNTRRRRRRGASRTDAAVGQRDAVRLTASPRALPCLPGWHGCPIRSSAAARNAARKACSRVRPALASLVDPGRLPVPPRALQSTAPCAGDRKACRRF